MKKLFFLILVILFLTSCSIKSADQYYKETENGSCTATISINCSTAVKYKNSKRKKADILKNYKVNFKKGSTVFNALKNACKANKIQFEYSGSGDSVYIEGIDYLYEFDCGEHSGWEYSVNGKFPGVGCNAYKLKDGDNISWLYTCDLGADIGNRYNGG